MYFVFRSKAFKDYYLLAILIILPFFWGLLFLNVSILTFQYYKLLKYIYQARIDLLTWIFLLKKNLN